MKAATPVTFLLLLLIALLTHRSSAADAIYSHSTWNTDSWIPTTEARFSTAYEQGTVPLSASAKSPVEVDFTRPFEHADVHVNRPSWIAAGAPSLSLQLHQSKPASPWDDMENMEGHNVVPPVAVSCNADHMDVYGFFFQNLVKRKLWKPATGFPPGKKGWSNVGPLSYFQAGVAAHKGDDIFVDCVVTDENYDVIVYSNTGDSWMEDPVHLNKMSFDTPLALAVPGDGLLVVIRGTDNMIYGRSRRGRSGSWTTWKTLGGPYYSRPTGVAMPDGSVYLFALDGQNHIVHKSIVHGRWSGWNELPYLSLDVPTVAPYAHGFVLTFRQLDASIVTGVYCTGTGFSWTILNAISAVPPSIASPSADRIHAYSASVDGALVEHVWFDGKGWSDPTPVGGSVQIESPTPGGSAEDITAAPTESTERIIFSPSAVARGSYVEVFIVEASSVIRHYTSKYH